MRNRIVVSAAVVLLCLFCAAGCTLPVNVSVPDTGTETGGDETPPADDSVSVDSEETDTPAHETDTSVPETDTPAPETDTFDAADTSEQSPETDGAPPEEDTTDMPGHAPRIPVPSPIGKHVDTLGEIPFPEEQILLVYSYYPLPVGTVFEATYVGERTDAELYVSVDSILVLHVSKGIEPRNVTVDPDDKTVYLTFDDGPSKTNTLRVLDILDEYGVKATFFLVGESVKKHPDLVCEIYARGHKIGCHSYSHVYNEIYASVENMRAEIERWETAVEEALGFVPAERLFRFPGGSTLCNEPAIREMLAEEGWRAFDWNAVSNDCLLHTRPKEMSEEEYIKESVITTLAYSFRLKTSPHIMLMHDTYAQTADMLAWMIEYMIEQGCTFSTPDALESGWLHGGT